MENDTKFANEQVVEEYLQALLDDGMRTLTPATEMPEPQLSPVAPVAERVQAPLSPNIQPNTQAIEQSVPSETQSTLVDSVLFAPQENNTESLQSRLNERFQALFLNIAGLNLAVPLVELGGIHKLGEVSAIQRDPDWYMGIMIKHDEKINCVDTAKWVMPDKLTPELAAKLDYQYVVMLGDSRWGLTCESLVNTVELTKQDIKWSQGARKRAWMAGLVKEKMCVMLDVPALVAMLDKGADRNH